jgi:phosphate starvation-inducible protein PhoH
MAIVTRIGKKNAKFIFCGDIKQNDIAKKYVAVNVLKKILTGVPNVAQFEFTEDDNMRDDMVKLILKNYDTLEQAGELTPNRKNA